MSTATFRVKAPKLMARVISEFTLSVDDAAAIAGNAGHESGGLAILQEVKPTVPGSKGGYGWFQWTGPRRVAFEAYCVRNRMKPSSDEANTAFLIYELYTTEARAIPAVKSARSLSDKVVAFERAFERAGVKHYPSRLKWAEIARDAYLKTQVTNEPVPIPPPPDIEPIPIPVPPPPAPPSYKPSIGQVMIGILIAGLMAAIAHFFGG